MAKYKTFKVKLIDFSKGKWDRRLSQDAVKDLINTITTSGTLLPVGDGNEVKSQFRFDKLAGIPELAARTGSGRIGYIFNVKVEYDKDGLIAKVYIRIRVRTKWIETQGSGDNYKLTWKPIFEVAGCIIKQIYGVDLYRRKLKPAVRHKLVDLS